MVISVVVPAGRGPMPWYWPSVVVSVGPVRVSRRRAGNKDSVATCAPIPAPELTCHGPTPAVVRAATATVYTRPEGSWLRVAAVVVTTPTVSPGDTEIR